MNLQVYPETSPLKVLVINPLLPASQILLMKICNGSIFGQRQQVDIVLLFFDTELLQAEALKVTLENCAYKCMHSIVLTSTIPRVTDADVFCFMSGFKNPNDIRTDEMESADSMNMLYVIAKVAQNFVWPVPLKQPKTVEDLRYKKTLSKDEIKKPIILADGLVAITIIQALSVGLPHDILFYCSPLTAIARGVLGRKIKAKDLDTINTVYVWGADDSTFHVEIEKPMIKHDPHIKDNTECDWSLISKQQLLSTATDHTQFNAVWLKKGFIEEVCSITVKRPFGAVSRASYVADTLRTIWRGRGGKVADNVGSGKVADNVGSGRVADNVGGGRVAGNIGVISDGSLQTIKGLPYVLPVVIDGDTWKLNDVFADDSHLKMDIKKINELAKMRNNKLTNYCQKMLKKAILIADVDVGEVEEEWISGSNTFSSDSSLESSTSSSSSSISSSS